MKKGLLSLLAVALTVVGCQNYDDQFQSLTDQIAELSSALDTDVAAVRGDITALQALVQTLATAQQVTALSNSVGELSDDVSDLTDDVADVTSDVASLTDDVSDVSDDVADVQGDVTANNTLLGQISSTLAAMDLQLDDIELDTAQLDQMSATLVEIAEDVEELLSQNAVINQNIVINNTATLELAEGLIGTDADDPAVIINGYVDIETADLSTDELARANAVAAKIGSILGDDGGVRPGLKIDSSAPMTLTSLTFIDDDYEVEGSDQTDEALRTISGNLIIDHGGAHAPINYSQLASVGGDVFIDAADAATATIVNFDNVDITGKMVVGAGAGGVFTFPGAASVNLGTVVFTSLTAANADEIISRSETSTSLTVVSEKANNAIRFPALETSTGPITITGTNTSDVFLTDLETLGGAVTIIAEEAHIGALEEVDQATDITASTIDISSVATVSAALDLNTAATVLADDLVEVDALITYNVGVISFPNANLDTGTITSTVATNVTIKALDVIADVPASTTSLTLTGQDVDLGATGAVTHLKIVADGASVDLNAAGATLDHVIADGTLLNDFAATTTGLISVKLTNTGTNTIQSASGVATVTLAGTVLSLISSGTSVAEFNNTATFKDIPGTTTGETPITIWFDDSDLTSVDLSSMERVAYVNITNNAALTEVVAPSTNNVLTPGITPVFTILTNSIQGTYTNATAAFAGDGINPATPYEEACLHLPGLSTWKAYIDAINVNTNTPTIAFDYENGGTDDQFGDDANADSAQTHSAGIVAGDNLDAYSQLSLISATACN